MIASLNKVFQRPQDFNGARDIALQAGAALSRLYRSFEGVELASPRDFLIAAKVWHGYSYIKGRGGSVREVAAKLGYKQHRVFTSHVRLVFGLTPRSPGRHMPMVDQA